MLSLEVIIFFVVKQTWVIIFKSIVLISLFVVGLVLAHYNLFILPWGLNNALICIPFLAIGYSLRKLVIIECKVPDKKTILSIFAIILLLVNCLCVYHFGCNINISRLDTGNLLFYLSIPFIGTGTWYFVSKAIGKNSLLQWLGSNSLAILAFHSPIGRALTFILGKLFDHDKEGIRENFLTALLLIVLTLLVCWPICLLWNKLYSWLKTRM